jgi:hypothetical protein
MPTSLSFQVSKDLYLIQHTLDQASAATPKVVETPTNHFAVIDCSGSMSYDLPKIREQLKRKLPKLLKETDTMTIIWFSGRGQFGTLLEAEPVATLKDLKAVEAAIDRWLRPQGLTGFKEPLEEAAKVVERVNKKLPGSVSSLFFMSDGCDNQWPRADVLKAVEKAAGGFASATIVEYGYYADRPLLTAMAEKSGGAHIFAEDFDKFDPAFSAAMQKKQSGAKRVEVKVPGDPIGGFVYALDQGDLITYAVEGGKTVMPEGLATFFYLSPTSVGVLDSQLDSIAKANPNGDKGDGPALSASYAAVALFAGRMKPNVVFPLLKALGDVKLIEQFANCFGKQKYSAFQETAQQAAFGKGRFEQGRDPNKVPREDAFTVLDVLQLLASDDANRVLLEHSDFKYSRIGRGRLDASDQLTEAEQEEITRLTSKLASEKNATKIKEITDQIAAVTANKAPALKFEANPAPDGYPISSLTFNEDRPNVSFLVRKAGTVDLSSRTAPDGVGPVPTKFPTNIFRNYAVIKDGLVNIDKLPVRITAATLQKLVSEGVCPGATVTGATTDIVLDLKALPVINRKMVKDVSAKTFFETQYALTLAQAEAKVYNSFSKELLPSKRSEGIAAQYNETTAAWLKEQGITDGGFQPPKTTQAEATDFYMGKELKVSLKGLSKLPSLKEVKEQILKSKINAGGALMVPTVRRVEAFLASEIYTKAANKDGVLEAWLEGQTKAAKQKTRDLIFKIAQTTFTLVVGQVWFSEFSSLDENTLNITVDNATIECKAEMKEVEIKI